MYVLLSHNLGTQTHTPLTPSHFTCQMYHYTFDRKQNFLKCPKHEQGLFLNGTVIDKFYILFISFIYLCVCVCVCISIFFLSLLKASFLL